MEGRTKAGTEGGPPFPASGLDTAGAWVLPLVVATAPLLELKFVPFVVTEGPFEGVARFVSSPGRFKGGRVGRVSGGGFFTAPPVPGAGVPAGGFNAGNFWSGRGDCAAPLPVPPFKWLMLFLFFFFFFCQFNRLTKLSF